MTGVFIAVGIVLVIVALVVRDQTEYRLGRLRAELLGLRSEAQRLGHERSELERMIAQAGDALLRADHRQRAADKARGELVEMLERLGIDVSLDAGPNPAVGDSASEPG